MEARLKSIRAMLGSINGHYPECALMDKLNVKETMLFVIRSAAAGRAVDCLSKEVATELMLCPVFTGLLKLLEKAEKKSRTYTGAVNGEENMCGADLGERVLVAEQSVEQRVWTRCEPRASDLLCAWGIIGQCEWARVESFVLTGCGVAGYRANLKVNCGWWYAAIVVPEGRKEDSVLIRVLRCLVVRSKERVHDFIEYEQYEEGGTIWCDHYPILQRKTTSFMPAGNCLWYEHALHSFASDEEHGGFYFKNSLYITSAA